MKLSEAIRIGAQKSKPTSGTLFQTNGAVKACALGCAGIGAGLDMRPLGGEQRYDLLKQTFPQLLKQIDFGEGYPESLYVKIYKLNDRTEMTREEIADWVEAQGF